MSADNLKLLHVLQPRDHAH